jgi:hypothetical protein
MSRKLLPATIGVYRIILPKELTPEQLAVLRAASAQRIRERLCVLIGDGRVSVSQVQASYGALMAEVGRC